MWYLYIVRCSDKSLYTGITTDLKRRIKEHNSHTGKGSAYASSRRPVKLAYKETCRTRSKALKREAEIKKWPKSKKELFIKSNK